VGEGREGGRARQRERQHDTYLVQCPQYDTAPAQLHRRRRVRLALRRSTPLRWPSPTSACSTCTATRAHVTSDPHASSCRRSPTHALPWCAFGGGGGPRLPAQSAGGEGALSCAQRHEARDTSWLTTSAGIKPPRTMRRDTRRTTRSF
jgi:hypothetical protein